jgi:hypothetical protein
VKVTVIRESRAIDIAANKSPEQRREHAQTAIDT